VFLPVDNMKMYCHVFFFDLTELHIDTVMMYEYGTTRERITVNSRARYYFLDQECCSRVYQ
jgi:hypothetical protein